MGFCVYFAHDNFTALLSSTLRFNEVPHVSETVDESCVMHVLRVHFVVSSDAFSKLLPPVVCTRNGNDFVVRAHWMKAF